MNTDSFALFVRPLALLILLQILAQSCVLAPINSHYESASTVKKSHLEVSAHAERYDWVNNGEATKSNYNYGAIVGYGFSEKFDVKLRYSFLNQFNQDDVENFYPSRYNFFSLAPKYQLIENILAVKAPVGLYAYFPSNGESESVVTFSPAIIGTFPLNEKADISLIAQYQISSNNYNDFLGLSLGFGFSNDLSKWAIRPEIGYQFDTWYMDGTGYFNFGLSCAYSFDIIK